MTDRRKFFAAASAAALAPAAFAQEKAAAPAPVMPWPRAINPILFSCKYTMTKGRSLEERFQSVKDAGYDGIDFDDCGPVTAEQVRSAAWNTGLFVHNAINHTHWGKRFTSANEADAEIAAKNLDHCLRVSHAAGGSGVLLVVGAKGDGPIEVLEQRCRERISKHLPLAAALGQRILFENVWNGMHYTDKGPGDQGVDDFVKFIDSFKSPWIGSYFDIGNHHRYAHVGAWIRKLDYRIAKLDLKGYDKKKALESGNNGQWRDIVDGDIDWADVRAALKEINFHGWSTAEVGGGDTKRLAKVLGDMKKALLG
ncbi:MAG: hypothetical protein RL095_4137 [Verrucomicrobiota bacterium]|jgi:hexulose-6-phosphate isomerase